MFLLYGTLTILSTTILLYFYNNFKLVRGKGIEPLRKRWQRLSLPLT